MRRIGPIIILSLLVFTAPAAAKGVSKASVCGPASCKDVKDERLLAALADAGNYTDPPAAGSPWFRANVTFQGDGQQETYSFVVVPKERKLLGEDGTWMAMLPQHVEEYDELVTGLEPFPASKLAGVDPSFAPPAAPPVPDDGGGLGAGWIAGGLGVVLLAGAGLLGLRRRRRSRQAGSGAAALRASSAGAGRPT